MAAFLITAGVMLLALAVHPFVTYPASLALFKRLFPKPVAAARTSGTAALCVCAYNEEAVIRAKAENMIELQRAYPQLSLLVYVDGASDRTRQILSEFEDRIQVIASDTRAGKTHGMNTLVSHTQAEFVVFSDANVRLAPDAIQQVLAPFSDPEVGGVCGHLRYHGGGGAATATTGSLYWRLEETIKKLESATGSVIGADGSLFAIRRALHQPVPVDLIEDMFVSLSVLCAGHRFVRAEHAVAMEEVTSGSAEEFRRKVRISCQAFNVHRAMAPRLRRLPLFDSYKYISHKLLRWFTIYLLAAGGLCLTAGMAMVASPAQLAVPMIACAMAAAWIVLGRDKRAAALRSILSAFLATGLGILRSLRGDRFQTWTPPASARAAFKISSEAAG